MSPERPNLQIIAKKAKQQTNIFSKQIVQAELNVVTQYVSFYFAH